MASIGLEPCRAILARDRATLRRPRVSPGHIERFGAGERFALAVSLVIFGIEPGIDKPGADLHHCGRSEQRREGGR
ncbi:hypothetical protein BQ8482_140046 [Mesorhizobium delmotii]|uniref:Uncharacterized protein n=1 Tax=Mesorhizobium delmotii TaxID=1631247 RepID=A0A2P9AGZ8_9HYPH|nr:hypothetical protein BQ8482_140046 [Mesorhizobium delmotii]